MKQISIIVAMTENNVIGKDNQLLWHLPQDLKHFKAVTMGKPIIMGRKTFESIGKPLPGRQNIILSKNTSSLGIPGCSIAHSVNEVLALTKDAPEIMIIGGGEIYRLFFPLSTLMYITYVHTQTQISGDVSFVDIDTSEWQEISREHHTKDEKHLYDYSFVILKRIENQKN